MHNINLVSLVWVYLFQNIDGRRVELNAPISDSFFDWTVLNTEGTLNIINHSKCISCCDMTLYEPLYVNISDKVLCKVFKLLVGDISASIYDNTIFVLVSLQGDSDQLFSNSAWMLHVKNGKSF
jgi:hypothetical protein